MTPRLPTARMSVASGQSGPRPWQGVSNTPPRRCRVAVALELARWSAASQRQSGRSEEGKSGRRGEERERGERREGGKGEIPHKIRTFGRDAAKEKSQGMPETATIDGVPLLPCRALAPFVFPDRRTLCGYSGSGGPVEGQRKRERRSRFSLSPPAPPSRRIRCAALPAHVRQNWRPNGDWQRAVQSRQTTQQWEGKEPSEGKRGGTGEAWISATRYTRSALAAALDSLALFSRRIWSMTRFRCARSEGHSEK